MAFSKWLSFTIRFYAIILCISCVCAKSLQSCLTLCNSMDCGPPVSSAHGVLQQEYWSGLPFPSPKAAAKSLQSCPTLCDPIDGSPSGSPVPGILQARTLEWVAISFSTSLILLRTSSFLLILGCLYSFWSSYKIRCHIGIITQMPTRVRQVKYMEVKKESGTLQTGELVL